MCCFSRPVDKVADTHIFARAGKDNKQFLVYSMYIKASEDLAMVLPIPTPKNAAEDAVRFLSLKDYADFFADMLKGFPTRGLSNRPGTKSKKKDDAEPKLVVVKVGSFEASFVPKVSDFARLDERFRLPGSTWDALPAYTDYGFCVFKLAKGEKKIHPMAFEFPRADKNRLFFPTVHIHDGKIHKTATFDHILYCQKSGKEDTMSWTESPQLAGAFLKTGKAEGIVDKDAHVYRLMMRGKKT